MTKSVAIVIPVKAPQLGKSRLAPVMTDGDRQALNRWLYRHTFDEIAPLADQARVHVVSKSPEVLAEAADRGFTACREPDGCDLNGALAAAAARARADGMTAIMIVPIDLPLLTTASVRGILDRLDDGLDMLMVADSIGSGTNLILWREIARARFLFGPDSAAAYAEFARGQDLQIAVTRHDRLSFDLDTPADIAKWLDMRDAPRPRDLEFR